MSKKCKAFGMKTIYHNRKPLDESLSGGAAYVSFDELLAQSDVLSLCLPLNVSRKGVIKSDIVRHTDAGFRQTHDTSSQLPNSPK